jgi:hypothetical protein
MQAKIILTSNNIVEDTVKIKKSKKLVMETKVIIEKVENPDVNLTMSKKKTQKKKQSLTRWK